LKKYEPIKIYVEKVIRANSKYGIRRIKAELKQRYDVNVGRDTLAKLLPLWGLSLKRTVKKHKPNIIQKILLSLADKTNLLIRATITKPLQALTSDITEIYFNNGKSKCYLCVHKDVFGQMVYGSAVGLTANKVLVIASFKQAMKTIKKLQRKYGGIPKLKHKLLMHQDRGSQYTSYAYVETVLNNNCKLSYSTPRTPTENPGQESFFGRFKEECADELADCQTFEQAQKLIKRKLRYYNRSRIHTSTGYTKPFEYTKRFLKTRGK